MDYGLTPYQFCFWSLLMSQVTFLIERIIGDLGKLSGLVKNAPLNRVEIRVLFKMLHDLLRFKSKIEVLAANQNGGTAVTEYLGIEPLVVEQFVKASLANQTTACKDNQYADYDVINDRLHTVDDICKTFNIKCDTLNKWRHNWPNRNVIDLNKTKYFPPPIIYVYGSPLWSYRQINWWRNTMNNLGFFKVEENVSNRDNG